ncbi:hypothetical protein HWA77_17880 [Photobacterium damselae subsp. damselae]|uniref:Lipopolysaccharide biosynthesis protein n=1 Tax=Photobacterium damselae subsp. damselae TaxID=85581 RepID=A0A850QTW9_PHODD|nr:hypothetical protein [Photobacterium damselae subsp. damselae]
MKKDTEVLFFGFSDDYDLLQIEELRKYYKISIFTANNVICYLYARFGSNEIINKLISKYFSIRLAELSKDAIVICIDKPIYLNFVNVIDNKYGILFRNTYDYNDFPLEFVKDKLCFSFDRNDCRNFNFIYYNQYINQDEVFLPKSKIIDNDFYFIGMDKGRRVIIERLVKNLKKINSDFKFSINIKRAPNNKLEKYLSVIFYNKDVTHISYKENLKNIASSKVIIDIVKDGQIGITLKTLEALVYGKKIITNNKMIVNYDFYDEKQIYIINDTDNDECHKLNYFLNNKFDCNTNLDKYVIKSVFDKIISKIKGSYNVN